MKRFQVHLAVHDEAHAEADPQIIVIVNAHDDEAAFEHCRKLLPDGLDWDMTEVECAGCSMPADLCECHLPVCGHCGFRVDSGENCPHDECPMPVEAVAVTGF